MAQTDGFHDDHAVQGCSTGRGFFTLCRLILTHSAVSDSCRYHTAMFTPSLATRRRPSPREYRYCCCATVVINERCRLEPIPHAAQRLSSLRLLLPLCMREATASRYTCCQSRGRCPRRAGDPDVLWYAYWTRIREVKIQ
ncbi:uncharacterized protein HMPREF1120_02073 [Exophiala dermatitidis NIH/UT8656]|uniref:Uncharacterized protein n=1 Tax=Exophiala dermatitidis (strain ATCC 34100 / CBS 525.76 / NIH/UT8656) TaxID=858893 RepID=H6BQY0_EXODN|nr:uncharacterized protein HMPREF1120_02073 [Exophiala dermatitidis NIH/UT8656]EHY53893.1 hypothetical protein HMPREF1120_02073 [Exophiala dermatitidis NIH/UT8656]